ncbi:MAG: RHS repeat-associated core domain-containing protein [Pseudomonadota bacterium]
MAKNFGARKNSKYKVVSSSPSVNKTPRGSSTPNIPYDVQQDLGGSEGTSPNVFFNSDPVYVKTSHSTKVTGDKEGSSGGVKSGTVGAQSDPIEASPSVFVNGKAVVRVGDKQYMQGKNTVGKVTSSESGSAAHITDEGKIEGITQPEPIPEPYAKNKPTNNSGSGSLGSRTGSPVLLASGKLFYTQSDVELIASIAFGLRRTYISDGRTGIFGRGWQSSYETRLNRSDPHTLSLIFTDDQTYRFTYAEKGFIDTDDLGAKLTIISPQTFLLEYFHDAHTELHVNGFLTKIKDRNGNTLDFIRENNGKLIRITSHHVTLSFSYNKEGLVSQVSDHTHRVWSYTYNTSNEQPTHYTLTHVTDPMGGVMHYVYQKNAPYLLERIIDESGVTILDVTYDTVGRVESYTEEALSYTYRYEPNRVIKTEATGDKTIYGIDNFGAIRAITYPDGSTTREEYHDNISIVIDEGGNTHIRVFDNRHRLIREITPDKSTILYSYKGNNPYPSHINREDKITTHVYDERYNKLSTTYSDGTTESYSYEEVNGKARETTLGYDRGNKITFIDRSGVSTSYAYNDLGQQIRISDALGGVTQNVYDDLGNLATIIDSQERIVQFEYDTLSRLIAITDNALINTRIYYDNAGRISAVREHSGGMTRYAYDSNGFLSRMINPADQLRIYTYEGNRLVSILREDGESYRFTYDKKGRRISQSIGDKTLSYSYDTLGNLLRIDDGLTAIEYVYDVNANILLERLGEESVSYAYNTDGSKRFIGYEGMNYQLQRDERGNLAHIRRGLELYAFQYDPLKNQTALSYPNRLTQKSLFDPLGRLIERSVADDTLVYTYDKSSRLTSRNKRPYLYDEAGRIILCDEESYAYDELGNIIIDNTLIDPLTHRLLRYGDSDFTYDTLGQMIEKTSPEARTTYTYDIEGYLIGYQRTESDSSFRARSWNPSPVLELRFTYDPLGRRISKHFKSFVVSQSNHETIEEYHHRYLYAGDNIVAIYDADTDELIATLLHDEGIDTPLSISVYPTTPLSSEEQYHYETLDESEQYLFRESRIQTYYYHRDHQNSILSLTDREGKIVESYSYDAYGKIIHSTKSVETYNPYGYTGREIDAPDLYYYRARYYDPTIGRFITPDPIGFMGGDTNFYRYVGNDPVNFIDDSGFSAHATGEAVNHSQQMLSKTTAGTNPTPPKPKPSNGGGASAKMNCGVKVAGTPPKLKEECCKKPVPAIAPTPNSPNYYQLRHDNYNTRHEPCGKIPGPPVYYKEYGYYYCNKFLTKTYQNLSPAGQKWLNETLKLLQIFMDKGLVNLNYTSTNNKRFTNKVTTIGLQAFYTGIECRNIDHKDFAFATHPDAYRPKDMKTLPCSDLLKISKTPDWKEWLDGATWEQANIMREKMGVWSTINNCSKAEAGMRTDQIKEKAEDLLESIRSLFQ